MIHIFEKVLLVLDEETEEIKGMYRQDIKKHAIEMYSLSKNSLEDIQECYNENSKTKIDPE